LCGSKSKLVNVVPSVKKTVYSYACPSGHRSQFVAVKSIPRFTGL